jgi:hypothetical protein
MRQRVTYCIAGSLTTSRSTRAMPAATGIWRGSLAA